MRLAWNDRVVVRERLMERWMQTMRNDYRRDCKRVYYPLSRKPKPRFSGMAALGQAFTSILRAFAIARFGISISSTPSLLVALMCSASAVSGIAKRR